MLYLYDILQKIELLMGLALIMSSLGMCIYVGIWIDNKFHQTKIRFARFFLTHRWFFNIIKLVWMISFGFWLLVPSSTMLKDKHDTYFEDEYEKMYLNYKTVQSDFDTYKKYTKDFIEEKCPQTKNDFNY